MMTTKCFKHAFLVLLVSSWLLPFALADVYYNANTYPFTFPSYGTAMGFSTNMVFDSDVTNRTNEYWYFNYSSVPDVCGFQTQVTNLLVTKFYVSEWINYTVFSYGTQKINQGSKPNKVLLNGVQKSEGDGWSYSSGITTVTGATSSGALYWGEADTTPPTYSSIAHNTTIETMPCQFSCLWEDETGLSGYIASSNVTGSWSNETWTAFSGNPAWANFTKTLPVEDTVVGYRWWANDTSNNWGFTPIQKFTTTGLSENIVVLLNTPSDGATLKTKSVTFTYIPVFFQTIVNASVWLNQSGWQAVAWNASAVQNNTINSITFSFSNSGTYKWNIAGRNSTQYVFAQNNRTLTMALEPEYDTISYSTTQVKKSCTFYSHWTDGDGLSGFILRCNVTGTWKNSSWTAWSGSPTEAWAQAVKTLPSREGVTVGFRFYANDTDNKWTVTPIQSFITTSSETMFSAVFTNVYVAIGLMGVTSIVLVAAFFVMALRGMLSLKAVVFLVVSILFIAVCAAIALMITSGLSTVFT